MKFHEQELTPNFITLQYLYIFGLCYYISFIYLFQHGLIFRTEIYGDIMPAPSAGGGHHNPAEGKRPHRSKNKGKEI